MNPKTAFLLLLPSFLSLDVLSSQETTESEKESPFKKGVADKEKVGELPPLTSETNRQAAAAFAEQKWEKARGLYRDVVKFAPDNALAQANLGTTCFQLGDYKSARTHLKRAVELNASLSSTRVTLGITYFLLEDYYLSISTLSQAVHENPKDPTAHNFLAVALRHKGWIDGAEEELTEAIRLSPEYAEAHFNLALVHLERKTPAIELARRHYHRAIELGAARDKIIEKQIK